MKIRLKYRALLIGHHFSLLRALPKLLNRSGFEVYVITTDPRCAALSPVRSIHYATDSANIIPVVSEVSHTAFDLVVLADDEVLLELVRSTLSIELKLKLLPVCTVDDFRHLGTKIGLSHLLKKAGIPTPAFTVANDIDELKSILRQIPYPVMLKNDISAGGAGVFEYFPGGNLEDVLNQQLVFPLLIQRRVQGDVIDLSAFYQGGELIHFSHAVMNSFANSPFGPSVVRTYTQLSAIPKDVFEQMRKLGRALGANGFTNITCLRDQSNGKHYLIEADMRPNVWVDYSRYMGDDLAQAIKKYFDLGVTLSDLQAFRVGYPLQLKIPYLYRLTALDVLTNRHKVWSFCESAELVEILFTLLKKVIVKYCKPMIGNANWGFIKSILYFQRPG